MKRTVLAAIFIFTMFFGIGAVHADYTVTLLTGPSGTSPNAYGVDGTNVVGDTSTGAFLYNISTAQYTTLNVPSGTTAYGIQGNYVVGGSTSQAWLYSISTNTYTTLTGLSGVHQATGIDGNNIVGYSSSGPWFYNGSNYTTSLGGISSGGANAISGNSIVGYLYSSSQYLGFLYNISSQSYITLNDLTGAKAGSTYQATYATGVNATEVAGYYDSYTTGYTGFLYNISTQQYTNFQVPNSTYTYIYGMDANGDLVGTTRVSGETYGFLATPTAVPVPAGILLLAPGLAGLAALRRKYIG
jgi:hypothetical protein